ncbi:MAG TPA: hypothetical protein PLE81_05855 [Brevundimonas sp.]|uniref:hypothetical protein n=1 Tax=Brevundimonas sp. TaxID=1871086 RepID=UPI002BB440AD|nr:hypothetical protein [Brevundimonas sp.]HRH20148.1 hypothetical protein [Brevundimonas sp.]
MDGDQIPVLTMVFFVLAFAAGLTFFSLFIQAARKQGATFEKFKRGELPRLPLLAGAKVLSSSGVAREVWGMRVAWIAGALSIGGVALTLMMAAE